MIKTKKGKKNIFFIKKMKNFKKIPAGMLR